MPVASATFRAAEGASSSVRTCNGCEQAVATTLTQQQLKAVRSSASMPRPHAQHQEPETSAARLRVSALPGDLSQERPGGRQGQLGDVRVVVSGERDQVASVAERAT